MSSCERITEAFYGKLTRCAEAVEAHVEYDGFGGGRMTEALCRSHADQILKNEFWQVNPVEITG